MQLAHAGLNSPFNAVQLLLVAAVAASSNPVIFGAAICSRLFSFAIAVPFVWDSYFWCAQTDAALLFALLPYAWASLRARRSVGDRQDIADVFHQNAGTARWQLSLFYAASGFWKINTSFLNPRYSCAPFFVFALLDSYLPGAATLSTKTLQVLATASAWMTISGELAIAVLLARKGWSHRLGVMLAILLHGGIAIVPPPNNAVPFSVSALTRVLLTIPQGLELLLEELRSTISPVTVVSRSASGLPGMMVLSTAAAAAAAATAAVMIRTHLHPAFSTEGPDLFVAMYAVLAVLACRALMLESRKPSSKVVVSGAGGRMRHAFFVLVAATYAFGLPLLGLQDLGSCNMYSNLRLHGGSNHLLLPTGLLQSSLHSARVHALGGGVVRVEATNSTVIDALYPAELTPHFRDSERLLLQRAGHGARMFSGGKARVLGIASVPPRPPDAPAVPFTVTALEFRRLLAEARAAEEAFSVSYARLPGCCGDESWRINATDGPRVYLVEDGRGSRSCKRDADECDADELAMLPPPRLKSAYILGCHILLWTAEICIAQRETLATLYGRLHIRQVRSLCSPFFLRMPLTGAGFFTCALAP